MLASFKLAASSARASCTRLADTRCLSITSTSPMTQRAAAGVATASRAHPESVPERTRRSVRRMRPSSPSLLNDVQFVEGKVNLVGLPAHRMQLLMDAADIPEQTAKKILRSIHSFGAKSIHDLEVSAARRAAIAERFTIDFGRTLEDSLSEDGTRKWLVEVGPGMKVETVFIPETSKLGTSRGVLCVSSQVGCTLDCSFCHTGTQPFEKNLLSSHILSQLLTAKHALNDFTVPSNGPRPAGSSPQVTNVVFQGQGEPLYNYRNVRSAIDCMTNPEVNLCGIASKRVTVSTSGVVPRIPLVASELGVNLAVSLHAPNNELRNQIMGTVNRQFPLSTLLEACREYTRLDGPRIGKRRRSKSRAERAETAETAEVAETAETGESADAFGPDSDSRKRRGRMGPGDLRRIMFEYTMLDGVNDTPEHAAQLIDAVEDIPCHINLIPWNPWPGGPYKTSPDEVTLRFGQTLLDAGFQTNIRWPKGRDIMAACGQLHSAHVS